MNRPPEPPVDAEADRSFMRMALEEAQEAGMAGEIPVGAVVVADGKVIARGGNETLRSGDPTAHAEIVALRAAAAALANHRTHHTTLYVRLNLVRCVRALLPRHGAAALSTAQATADAALSRVPFGFLTFPA